MTDKKTAHLGLPLPDAGNALAEDCPRLAEALISLDEHVQSADARLDGVEASVRDMHDANSTAVHTTGDEAVSGVKTFTQTIAGTAAAAKKLATARTITLSGAASGSVSFDGSADATLEVACMVKNEEFTATNTTGRIIKYNDGLYILYANIDYAKQYDGITYFYFTFPEAFSVIPSVYITNCNKEIYYGFTARITTATNIRIDFFNIQRAIVYATTSSGDPKREFYSTDDFSLNLLAIGTWK